MPYSDVRDIALTFRMGRLGFRRVTLRVRVINRRQVSDQKNLFLVV